MIRRLLLLVLVSLLVAPAAHAAKARFTPESGLWWNPAESGRGYTIDIQDETLQLIIYAYRADGSSSFYTSAGRMNYRYSGDLLAEVSYTGTIDSNEGGQCLSCPYRPPVYTPNTQGQVRINFTSETTATMSFAGRTIPIERIAAALGNRTERMMGEWRVLIDFYSRGNGSYAFRDYPYFGDVLVVDRIERRLPARPDLFVGCRPTQSTDGFCRASARANHDLAGFLDANTGEHVIVVKDVPGTAFSDAVYLAYYVEAGTSNFDGVVDIYEEDQTPGQGPFYPVSGFRSASRTFVLTGNGPSSVDGDPKSGASAGGVSLAARADDGTLPPGLTAAEVRERYGIDVAALQPEVEKLARELAARPD